MQIKRKVVQQLLLTPEELDAVLDMAAKARDGQTVHYAEMQTDNGSYFGIGVGDEYRAKPRNEPVDSHEFRDYKSPPAVMPKTW